jgi:hypothetical protein
MISMSSVAAAQVTTAPVSIRYVRIESWLGDLLLSDDVPCTGASEDQDASLRVPERLTFTVPALDAVYSWVPTSFASPLGAFGQRVRASLGIEIDNGQIEWVNRGWFVINTSSTDGDAVTVECLGLLALVDEAVLANEYQPAAGQGIAAMLRDLLEPGITINDDAAPPDRVAPATITFSDNRLDAVLSILDAWPATAAMDPGGFLAITDPPPLATAAAAVLHLTDDGGGTVINYGGSVTREGAFNAVVAKGQYPDADATRAGQEILATAADTDPNSPYRLGGPFSPYTVPYGYASPLMSTPLMVTKAAISTLRRLRRAASLTLRVTAAPHPGIQLGDVVTLTSARLGLNGAVGTIDAFTLPYHPDGGPMALTVRLGV